MTNYHFEDDTKNFISSIFNLLPNGEKKVNIKSLIKYRGFFKTDKLDILISLEDKGLIKIEDNPLTFPLSLGTYVEDTDLSFQSSLNPKQRKIAHQILHNNIIVDDELIYLYKNNFQGEEVQELNKISDNLDANNRNTQEAITEIKNVADGIDDLNETINSTSTENQKTIKQSAQQISSAIENQGDKTKSAVDDVATAINGTTDAVKDLKPTKCKLFLDKWGAIIAIITAITSTGISIRDCSHKDNQYKELKQKVEKLENNYNKQNHNLEIQIDTLKYTPDFVNASPKSSPLLNLFKEWLYISMPIGQEQGLGEYCPVFR